MKIATPDADGRVYHVVQAGQSFWSIAITYQITIQDIETWNNISRNTPLQSGQRLFIPDKNTAGYATPTPRGMVNPSAPDADGRIIHEVQPYQALLMIADAYGVTVERILALNGLQADWPLQIGQKLLISPGNVTPSPTLSNIQKLTPEDRRQVLPHGPERRDALVDRRVVRRSACGSDELEWTEYCIRYPPRPEIAPAGLSARNSDVHARPGNCHATPNRFLHPSPSDCDPACCRCRASSARIQPGTFPRHHRDRHRRRRTALVETAAQKLTRNPEVLLLEQPRKPRKWNFRIPNSIPQV